MNLSPYQLNQLEIHNEKHSEKISKLVPNFYDKERYVSEILYWKGLVVEQIHRVLQFKQSDLVEEIYDFNTTERAKSKSDFEKDFFNDE